MKRAGSSWPRRWVPFLGAAIALSTGCTDAELVIPPLTLENPLDNRIDIDGGFCAEGADDVEAQLKIMMIIDRSNSMLVTDPNNQRIEAARQLVERFLRDPVTLELQPGVEFSVISFYGQVVTHTRDDRGLPGFTDDGTEILFSLTQIARVLANTGYDAALATAFLLLDRDMAQLSDKARARSRYEVIFLSDGLPFPDNCPGESNSPDAVRAAAGRIADLQALHNVPIRLSTAFASDPRMFQLGNYDDPCDASDMPVPGTSIGLETSTLLSDMAAEGGGSFTQFANGDAISFEGFDFADSTRIFGLSSFIASNLNAQPNFDQVAADSDMDGITDEEEEIIGSSPYNPDSDGDGFSDGVEWRFRLSGFDPLDPTDADCPEFSRVDTDGDGLLDCEESFLGTFRRRFDSDADGIPDQVEVMFGSDANSANPIQDRQTDSDSDGGTNAEELRWHTDPRRVDVAERSRIAYDYFQEELPLTSGFACYNFEVSNISLASTDTLEGVLTRDGVKQPPGWNRIMMYMAQTPYDDPLGDPLYRVACVDARFVEDRDLKMPAGGQFTIPDRRPSDTYRATDVVRPHGAVCQASVNIDCGVNTVWCRFEPDGACNCWDPPPPGMMMPDGVPRGPCPVCANGQDDDGDGLTDFPFDPDCFDSMDGDEGPNNACSNGQDDDGDSFIDWPRDPGCDDSLDNDETDPAVPTQCFNGIDDDNDGATDWPFDPGCYATADNDESESFTNPIPDCGDGFDNDGDGLIDTADPGCFNIDDIDEDGPQACFFCELVTDLLPGQCDIGLGLCRARSSQPPAGGCTSNADCRGSVCDLVTGDCDPCLSDIECDSTPGAGDGLCDTRRGWCLSTVFTPAPCTTDAECAGTCDTDLGFCNVDPYYACRDERDCRPDEICSPRGFCMEQVFETRQCDADLPCDTGICDEGLGWCLPNQGSEQCVSDAECPKGDCLSGYCDQQSFVFPEEFRPEIDCLRAR